MPTATLRLATLDDCRAIHDIYNHYVIHSTCTYQTEPDPLETRMAWFSARGPLHPVTVAELEGRIVGWGSLSPFHVRQAYARTVETAVYIHHQHRGIGLGRLIVTDLIGRARALDHHTIIALVSAEQAGSLALHEKLGFVRAGHLFEAGYKFGQWLDVIYLQKML
jgi:phosphinothricin acetyltransferase